MTAALCGNDFVPSKLPIPKVSSPLVTGISSPLTQQTLSLPRVIGTKSAYIESCQEKGMRIDQAHAHLTINSRRLTKNVIKFTLDSWESDRKDIADIKKKIDATFNYFKMIDGLPSFAIPKKIVDHLQEMTSGKMMSQVNEIAQDYLGKNVLPADLSRFQGNTIEFLKNTGEILEQVSKDLKSLKSIKGIYS